MDTPLVSILLPTYNGARYIWEAIDSVLNQDFWNLELIIIDDASTDMTGIILQKYMERDSRIIVLRNEQNLKLVATLNRGLAYARWFYIARIDDDDIWCDSSKLSRQLKEFEKNKNLWVVGTGAILIDELGDETGWSIIHHGDPIAVRSAFWLSNQLIHTSIVARKSVLLEAWGYRDDWLYVEDFDLWLRVLALWYEIMNIAQLSVKYRIREGNTTNKKYTQMQWLTFRRLFEDKTISPSFLRKWINLSIRSILCIFPKWLIRYLK